jgi:hypothetical protein
VCHVGVELVNTRPVDADLLAIVLDGKHVEVKDVDRLRAALRLFRRRSSSRRKEESPRLLHSLPVQRPPGMESRPSFSRREGLRRVLIVVHDDFRDSSVTTANDSRDCVSRRSGFILTACLRGLGQ